MNKKKVLTLALIPLIILVMSLLYYFFYSERTFLISTNVVRGPQPCGESVCYWRLSNNTAELVQISPDDSFESISFTQKNVSSILDVSYSIDGNTSALLYLGFSSNEQEEGATPTKRISIAKSGSIIYNTGTSATSLALTEKDLLVTYVPSTDFYTSDGSFELININNGKKQAHIPYTSEGVAFLETSPEIIFTDVSSHEGGVVGAVKKISGLNKVQVFKTVDGLVSLRLLSLESAIITRFENEKNYNVYSYNLKTGSSDLISKDNFDFRVNHFGGEYYFFESAGPIDLQKFGYQKYKDVLKSYPKNKLIIAKAAELKNCQQPLIQSEREMYYTCDGNLYHTKNYLH